MTCINLCCIKCAVRALPHRKATPHRVAPAPPAAIDTTERLREEVRCGRSRTGRLRLTVSRPHLRQLSTQPKDCGRRCDAGVPAPEGYASPCRARTSGSYRHNRKIAGGGAMRAFPHRKATPHRVAPAPPAAIDTTERLREEVRCGRSRTGRLRLTVSRPHLRQLSTQPKDCGRRCDAGVPAPEGYASPCRARTSGSYRHNRKIAGGGAMRAFPHRKATSHRVAPAPPAAIDTTERLREEVRCGRSRTGRLRLTVSRPHL